MDAIIYSNYLRKWLYAKNRDSVLLDRYIPLYTYAVHDNINYGYSQGSTELYITACRYGIFPLIRLLHTFENKHGSGLIESLRYGNLDIFSWLYTKIYKDSVIKLNLIDLAIINRDIKIIRYLHSEGEKFTDDSMGLAASNGDLDILQLLHFHEAPIFTHDIIAEAIKHSQLLVLKWCNKTLAIPNVRTHYNRQPCHYLYAYLPDVMKKHDLSIFKWVLDVLIQTPNKDELANYLVFCNTVDMAEYLFSKCGNITVMKLRGLIIDSLEKDDYALVHFYSGRLLRPH